VTLLRRREATLVAVLVALWAWPAPAQSPPGTDATCREQATECGRRAFEAGVAAFERGEVAVALERFQAAYALRPHPVIAFNLALAEAKNGLVLEALARLDAVQRDAQASEDLRRRASAERDAAAQGLATVVLESPGPAGATVMVDGAPMRGSPPRAQLNPGHHRVRVTSPGRVTLERDVRLLPGETLRISIDRSSELAVVVAPAAGAVPGPRRGGLDPTWFYAALGATAVVAGVGVWSGLDTLAAYRDYDRNLPSMPQDEIDRRVDEGHGKQTRTNVLVLSTAVLAAGTAAIGLFAVDWGTGERRSLSVQPTAGGLGLSARF
jgi:hypothetical protein